MNLFGISIEISQWLVGATKACKINDTIYVSPAMWDLMKDVSQEELQHLFKNLRVIDMGRQELSKPLGLSVLTQSKETIR